MENRRMAMTHRLVGVPAWAGVLFALLLAPASSNDGFPPVLIGPVGQFTVLRPVMVAPLTPIRTGSGGVTNLARFRGKVVLLNFWATWCPPCVKEMPALDRLQAALGGADFTVLTLSIDKKGLVAVKRFLERLKLTHLGAYLDPGATAYRAFGGRALPVSYIIDRAGRVRGYLEGRAAWDSAPARALIRHYIRG